MDIVYVLGSGSLWKDNEIRFSLRSVEKYLNGYNNIIVVGERPEWLINVVHLPCSDIKKRKEWSIMRKIMTACDYVGTSEDFLFFNDDHFLLRALEVKDVRYWYSSTLGQRSANSEGPNLRKVNNTMEILPPESYFFDIHVPMIYNKQWFKKIMSSEGVRWEQKDYLNKSLYANLIKAPDTAEKYEEMRDCKISTRLGYELIMDRIKDRLFFSVGPKGIAADLKRVLNELYPDKSKYEA